MLTRIVVGGIAVVGSAVVAGLAIVGGGARADSGDEASVAAADPALASSDAESPEAAIQPERYADTSRTMVAQMREQLTKALEQLRTAHDAHDSVMLACVNEKVVSMKGILRVAQEGLVALEEAIATNEDARAAYEFRKISASSRRMAELYAASLECVGASAVMSTTSVQLDVQDGAFDPYYPDDASFFFDPQSALSSGDTGALGQTTDPSVRPPSASGVL